MKNNMKTLNFIETLAVVLLFSHGFRMGWRGLFFVKERESVLNDSPFYVALDHFMAIWIWGVILLICGILIMISSIFVTSHAYNNICATLLVVGGFISFMTYMFLTSGSIYNAINWLTPIQMAQMAGTSLVIAFIGGVKLFATRK
ncbi:hypothetical protein [Staphylococcus kloosii]|uniref:Uncharacterized protein n=1 Tax=Staphylococcus kloosii TaxID=29384 RepID=A0A151A610_9STAP|nr:hypothetical protein [Staphylococcus kloosii]KYH14871.1 hypothetical protein A0131_08795 [Staphylococcus kloosii]